MISLRREKGSLAEWEIRRYYHMRTCLQPLMTPGYCVLYDVVYIFIQTLSLAAGYVEPIVKPIDQPWIQLTVLQKCPGGMISYVVLDIVTENR